LSRYPKNFPTLGKFPITLFQTLETLAAHPRRRYDYLIYQYYLRCMAQYELLGAFCCAFTCRTLAARHRWQKIATAVLSGRPG